MGAGTKTYMVRKECVHLAMGAEEELCVFLESGAHLASGAEWEPSGGASRDGYK